MALNFQNVEVKFTKGLDTRTQRKLVLPVEWDTLQNVALSKDATPQRRDGITGLVGAASGNGVAVLGKELLVVNGPTLSSVSTAEGAALTRPGSLGYVGVTKTEVRRSGGMQSGFDCASGGGFTAYVWIDSAFVGNVLTPTGVNCTVIDEATGAQVFSNFQLRASTNPICPRVVFSGNAFFFLYLDNAGAPCAMLCTVLEVPSMLFGTEVTLISAAPLSNTNFDAIDFGRRVNVNNGVMVSYWWLAVDSTVRTIQVSQTAGVPSIGAGPTTLFNRAQMSDLTQRAICCVAYTSNRAGTFPVALTGTCSGIGGAVIDDAWTVISGPLQLDATVHSAGAGSSHITGALQGNNVFLYADQQELWGSSPGFFPIRTLGCTATLAITTGPLNFASSATFAPNVGGNATGPSGPWICGKAFTSGTRVYLPCCVMERYTKLSADENTKNEQNAFFLLEALSAKHDTAVVVARALYGSFGFPLTISAGALANNPAPAVSTPCSVATLASGFALACAEQTILSLSNGLNVSATGVCRLTLTPNTTVAPIRTEFGQSAFFAGGQLGVYDGVGVGEHGFPLFPEGISVTRNAAAGDVTAGVHQVVAIYEYTDAQGRRHQSCPSQPVSFTSLGADTAVVVVPTLLLSQKTGVQIVLYMTQAAGLTFNRVISIASPVPNITTAESVSITLGVAAHLVADATIAGNELLYNQPNQGGTTLPNLSPGPCSALGLHQNRLFLDVTDNPNAFVYSQQLVPYVGLQFNPALGGVVPEACGGIVGWASMDEKVIIFGARKPCVLLGTGPNGSGGFSNYSDPIELPSDVGCADARSILKMPNGVIFKSPKGWYLMGRDLVVKYIGNGVNAFDANPVSSAVLLEDRQECRFASSSGTQLIYSYLENLWSTTVYRVQTDVGPVANYLVADALWWATPAGGEYVTISLTNGLNADTVGVFLDQPGVLANPLPIITTARTAWLHPSVLAGYQRIRWLYLTGTAPSQPTSTLNVMVDFDDVYGGVAPGSYNFNVLYGTIAFSGRSIDTRSKLRRQKCKSVAFTFTETPLVGNPAGVNFQALSLEVGLKRGLSKLPGTQSVG